jgi:hypothetical protein
MGCPMSNPSEWRSEIEQRDHHCCMATKLEPAELGNCYDKWGEPMQPCDTAKLEADYVRFGAVGGRHQFARDHVLLCPGHHRGTGPQRGQVWATSHRAMMRDYLESLA